MVVKDIINRVSLLYNDQDFIRCTKRQYLSFLDDAIAMTILTRPDSNTATRVITLGQGTRQTVPSEAYQLIDIYANVLDTSNDIPTYGRPIFQIARKDVDYFRDWHNDPSTPGEITEFSYDVRAPQTYWVWPPVGKSVTRVEMVYSLRIAPFGVLEDEDDVIMEMEIPMDSMYRTPLVNYMLYLLYSTDASSQLDRTNAQAYEQSFYQSLGVEYRSGITAMPHIFEQKTQGMGVSPADGTKVAGATQ